MIAHDLIERGLRGTPRFVGRRGRGHSKPESGRRANDRSGESGRNRSHDDEDVAVSARLPAGAGSPFLPPLALAQVPTHRTRAERPEVAQRGHHRVRERIGGTPDARCGDQRARLVRRPAKQASGDSSAEAWGPTSPPHADSGAYGLFRRRSLARPASRDFYGERPSGDWQFQHTRAVRGSAQSACLGEPFRIIVLIC